MSLSVPSVTPTASTASLNAASLLTNLSLTTAEQAQIAEVMAELQTGSITAVQARAQIDSILAAQSQASGKTSGGGTTPAPTTTAQDPLQSQVANLQSYYEMPLPQEKLSSDVLSAYTWSGASNTAGYSAPQHVNHAA